jgi:RNA polymerase-binding transcription factor DksA
MTNGRMPTRSDRPRTLRALEPAVLTDLTQVLQRQRAFRLDQLAGLDDTANPPSDPVRREVEATLRSAARLVLVEIEAALRRIELGSFGRCGRCGEVMSWERLTALPMSTWCGSCQHQRELAVVESSLARPKESA